MKRCIGLLVAFIFSVAVSAQQGTYIKYSIITQLAGAEDNALGGMMGTSSLQVASNSAITYTKLDYGALYTLEIEYNLKNKSTTVLKSGMMGVNVYRGYTGPSKLDNKTPQSAIKFMNGTKKILGYNCREARSINDQGHVTTYWFTTALRPITGFTQMPKYLPGVCLEMSTQLPDQTITYIAKKVELNAPIGEFKINLPTDIKPKPLSAFEN